VEEIFRNNAYKILEQFIVRPSKDFSARGIARGIGISHATALKYLKELEEEGFIKKNTATLYPVYRANTESEKYKFYKKNWLIHKMRETGLVEYIQKTALPSTIVLFGSGGKGTFSEKSDIDIFVESKPVKLELKEYEEKLHRKINAFFEQKLNNLSQELKNNIINGETLYGFIKD